MNLKSLGCQVGEWYKKLPLLDIRYHLNFFKTVQEEIINTFLMVKNRHDLFKSSHFYTIWSSGHF